MADLERVFHPFLPENFKIMLAELLKFLVNLVVGPLSEGAPPFFKKNSGYATGDITFVK